MKIDNTSVIHSRNKDICIIPLNLCETIQMKIRSKFLSQLHLDKHYSLLAAKDVFLIYELFILLDLRHENAIDDVQFKGFMQSCTDLTQKQINKVFDMLDTDRSGLLDFDEFYVLICILIAVRDNEQKPFIFHHSRTVFDILDEDGSGSISAAEFETFSFLFNFHGKALRDLFSEFDVTGNEELDYPEFKMLSMACIDRQTEIENLRSSRNAVTHLFEVTFQFFRHVFSFPF